MIFARPIEDSNDALQGMWECLTNLANYCMAAGLIVMSTDTFKQGVKSEAGKYTAISRAMVIIMAINLLISTLIAVRHLSYYANNAIHTIESAFLDPFEYYGLPVAYLSPVAFPYPLLVPLTSPSPLPPQLVPNLIKIWNIVSTMREIIKYIKEKRERRKATIEFRKNHENAERLKTARYANRWMSKALHRPMNGWPTVRHDNLSRKLYDPNIYTFEKLALRTNQFTYQPTYLRHFYDHKILSISCLVSHKIYRQILVLE